MNANLLVSNYQLESRMREIRQSGSVGGEPQSNAASLPQLTAVRKLPIAELIRATHELFC